MGRRYLWPGWVAVGCTLLGLIFVLLTGLVNEGLFPFVIIFVLAGLFLGIGQILKSPKEPASYIFLVVGAAPIVFFFVAVAPHWPTT
jgi:hypothetical protein